LKQKTREKKRRQTEEENRDKRKLLKRTAGSDSGVASTETNANKGGGSGSKRESPASRAGDDSRVPSTKRDTRGDGGSASRHKSPEPSAGGDSGDVSTEPNAGGRRTGKKPRGQTLRLSVLSSDDDADNNRPCLVARMFGGNEWTFEVETTIPVEKLYFMTTRNIQCERCEGETKRHFRNIKAAAGATFEDGKEHVKVFYIPTNMEIGTVFVCNDTPALAHSSQKSAESDRSTNLATLGLPHNASEYDIKQAYRDMALVWHPDKHKDSSEATDMFKRIHTAYTTLIQKD